MGMMALLVTVLFPAALLLAYGSARLQSPVMREAVWTGFLGGVAVSAAVWFWQRVLIWLLPFQAFAPLSSVVSEALLVRALPEEGVKLCLLLLLSRTVVRVGDARATILTSLGLSVGYAAMKAAAILLYPFVDAPETTVPEMAAPGMAVLLSVLSAMPQHGVCGLAMGALVAHACRSLRVSVRMLIPALLVPVAMHASYDFVLLLHQWDSAVFWTLRALPLVMAASVILSIVLCDMVVRRVPPFLYRPVATASGRAGALGAFMTIIGLAPLIGLTLRQHTQIRQELWLFCAIPLILGIDLMLTALRRAR